MRPSSKASNRLSKHGHDAREAVSPLPVQLEPEQVQLELGLAPAMQEPVPQEPAQDVMAERLALEPAPARLPGLL